jgi:hypothetical protein
MQRGSFFLQEDRDQLAGRNDLFWTPLEDTSRRRMTDNEDNRPLLHPQGQLVNEMEREACTGKRAALLSNVEDTGLDYFYMPDPQERPPTLGHMSKVCKTKVNS